jgi:hypothetical protein
MVNNTLGVLSRTVSPLTHTSESLPSEQTTPREVWTKPGVSEKIY